MSAAEEINIGNDEPDEITTETLILREYVPRTAEQLKVDLLKNIVIVEPVPVDISYLGVR